MRFALPPAFAFAVLAALSCAQPAPPDDVEEDDGPKPVISLDEVHVLGFGDSVTRGYCSTPGRGYFDLLVENDNERYPSHEGRDLTSIFASVTKSNKSVNGTTSCDYSEQAIRGALSTDTETTKPTLLLVTLGGNDLIHDYGCADPQECAAYCADIEDATVWAANFKDRMKGYIAAADDEIEGELFVFIANIYDPTDGVGDIENASLPLPPWPDGLEVLALYNQTIAEIAEETGSTLVDMHGAMLGHGIHYNDETHPHYDAEDPSYWFCANLEDPNDKGYRAIRDAFWSAISTRLNLE